MGRLSRLVLRGPSWIYLLLPFYYATAFVPPLLLPKTPTTTTTITTGLKAFIQQQQQQQQQRQQQQQQQPEEEQQRDNALERWLIYEVAAKMATILPDPRPPAKNVSYDQWAASTKQLLDGQKENSDPLIQSAKIARLLEEATPGFLRFLFRNFGGSRWGCEANALLAPYVSKWLVGPARRVEGPVETERGDETWQSTMLIEECRYLKAVGGCRHACVYLCKVPTQTFFQETLGVPVTLQPDFADNSCRMCFGQVPPASLEEDPVMQATEDGVPSLVEAACCGVRSGGVGKQSLVGENALVYK